MTQNQVLYEHFVNGGTLTVAEALMQFGVYALSQRCGELRRAGHPIERDMIVTETGKRVACYYWRVPFSF